VARYDDDLSGIDLSKLNLDDIDLQLEGKPSRFRHVLYGLFLLGLGITILWFPTSEYYQAWGANNAFMFVLAGGGTVVGIAFGRWLWRYLEEFTARYQARARARRTHEGPAPRWVRWGALLIGGGGAVALLYEIPTQIAGGETNAVGFVASVVAIIVGIVLGRWLLMQAQAARPRQAARPIRWPPWFKWVTLIVIITGALIAAFGSGLFGSDETNTSRFSLGSVAFLVGIFGAIWLARRFDETETKLREQTRRRGRSRQRA